MIQNNVKKFRPIYGLSFTQQNNFDMLYNFLRNQLKKAVSVTDFSSTSWKNGLFEKILLPVVALTHPYRNEYAVLDGGEDDGGGVVRWSQIQLDHLPPSFPTAVTCSAVSYIIWCVYLWRARKTIFIKTAILTFGMNILTVTRVKNNSEMVFWWKSW